LYFHQRKIVQAIERGMASSETPTTGVGEHVGKKEPSYTAGGNTN
jgi:hypothetical protein